MSSEATAPPAAAASDEAGRQDDGGDRDGAVWERHVKYLLELGKDKETFEYCVTEHLRVSGAYWALGALEILGRGGDMDKAELVEWVMSCYHPDCGGFAGNNGHDPHLLYTTSAVQILAMCDALERVDVDAVAAYVAGLQREDGSFAGDKWGEVDTRFSYCAVLTLAILGRLGAVDCGAAAAFVASCQNFDHGFGCLPDAESHAAQVFCCVGTLCITRRLALLRDVDELGWWLCERQCDSGGLNGRPEKQADVCYSWWVLSVLAMINRLHWIDQDGLRRFILKCQDTEGGGIADRPGNMADVFHTFFGLCGLSLLGHFEGAGYAAHVPVDPVFAMPVPVVRRLGLVAQCVQSPGHVPDAFAGVLAPRSMGGAPGAGDEGGADEEKAGEAHAAAQTASAAPDPGPSVTAAGGKAAAGASASEA